ITVSNLTVESPTQLTARLTIASGAALGTRNVTVTNPSGVNGRLIGGFTVMTTAAPAGPATLTLAYNGLLRDRVGQGSTQLGADTFLDGVWTVTLGATGGRQVTRLRIISANSSGTRVGAWDTVPAPDVYVMGA